MCINVAGATAVRNFVVGAQSRTDGSFGAWLRPLRIVSLVCCDRVGVTLCRRNFFVVFRGYGASRLTTVDDGIEIC